MKSTRNVAPTSAATPGKCTRATRSFTGIRSDDRTEGYQLVHLCLYSCNEIASLPTIFSVVVRRRRRDPVDQTVVQSRVAAELIIFIKRTLLNFPSPQASIVQKSCSVCDQVSRALGSTTTTTTNHHVRSNYNNVKKLRTPDNAVQRSVFNNSLS